MLQLHIENCPRDMVDDLSDRLEEIGALSVTLSDTTDVPIFEPELGTTPLWPNVDVAALYDNQLGMEEAKKLLSHDFPHLTYSVHEVEEQGWEKTCVEDFVPQRFGKRLWVCPSWSSIPEEPDAVTLVLDPGLAFGTGRHPTTSLCLAFLEQALLSDKTIIDYGCGSGILALATLKLGAHKAFAVDIDAQALTSTHNNAQNNNIPDKSCAIGFPATLNTPADILIANILLTPLIALKEHFRTLLKPTGQLVVSGILAEQIPQIVEAYQGTFEPKETHTEGDWALIVFSPFH